MGYTQFKGLTTNLQMRLNFVLTKPLFDIFLNAENYIDNVLKWAIKKNQSTSSIVAFVPHFQMNSFQLLVFILLTKFKNYIDTIHSTNLCVQ